MYCSRHLCEVDDIISTIQWGNEGSVTLSNHLQSGETGIQTHILDSESCVHSTRYAAPFGTKQNVTNPMHEATGRRRGREEMTTLLGGEAHGRSYRSGRLMFDRDKGVEETAWAEQRAGVWGEQEISVLTAGLVELWNIRLESREGQSHGHNELLAQSLNSTM